MPYFRHFKPYIIYVEIGEKRYLYSIKSSMRKDVKIMAWRSYNSKDNRVFKDALKINIRCQTITPMLGTKPGNPNIYRDYIESKAPDATTIADDLAAGMDVDDALENAMTVFPKARFFATEDGEYLDPQETLITPDMKGEFQEKYYIGDWQWRGAFKDFFSAVARSKSKDEPKGGKAKGPKLKAQSVSAYKKIVNSSWFVFPRRIPLEIPDTYFDDMGKEVSSYDANGNLKTYERPIRCSTPQGERTGLSISEMVPPGTEFWFTVVLLDPSQEEMLYEAMDYKCAQGMLQWRNGSMGRLRWQKCDEHGNPLDDEE